MSSPEGKEIILSGWKKLGIFDAIHLGLTGLPPLDPFADLCPLIQTAGPTEAPSLTSLFQEELHCFQGND